MYTAYCIVTLMSGRGGSAVHRLRENSLLTCVLHGHHDHSERVTIPYAVI